MDNQKQEIEILILRRMAEENRALAEYWIKEYEKNKLNCWQPKNNCAKRG